MLITIKKMEDIHIFDIADQDDITQHRVYCGKTLSEVDFEFVYHNGRIEMVDGEDHYTAFISLDGPRKVCPECVSSLKFQLKILREFSS